jgi:hypothetical protein
MARQSLVGFIAVFALASLIVPDLTFGRTAGVGTRPFANTSGQRGSTPRPAFGAARLSQPFPLNRRQSAFRGAPRLPFGFGFLPGELGFGYPFYPFDYGLPPIESDLGTARPPAFDGCTSFYCAYYDPSESTYVDPYYRPSSRDPSTLLGLAKPMFINRNGCDTEAVKVPSGRGEERTIRIVRC